MAAVVAEAIEREAAEHGVPMLEVDRSYDVDELVAAVESRFADALAEGPRVESPAGRRALLRDANEAIVAQYLAGLARPWSTGDPGTFVRDFVCECDDTGCDALVEVPVSAGTAGSVFASGHRCDAEDVRR